MRSLSEISRFEVQHLQKLIDSVVPHLHGLFQPSVPPKMHEFLRIARDITIFGSDAWWTTEHMETYMMLVKKCFRLTNWKVGSLIDQASKRFQVHLAAFAIRRSIRPLPFFPKWEVFSRRDNLAFVPSDLGRDASAFVEKMRASGLNCDARGGCQPRSAYIERTTMIMTP